tara:strand:- start:25107 stop:26390 length:1284 start_codon:yes stop_codon:yes gene_type:complete
MPSGASNILNLLTGGSGRIKEREDFEQATVDPATGEIVGGRDRFTQSKLGSFIARLGGGDTANKRNIKQNDLLQQMQMENMLRRSNNTQNNKAADDRQASMNQFTAGQGVIDTQNRKNTAENLANTNAEAKIQGVLDDIKLREIDQHHELALINAKSDKDREDIALSLQNSYLNFYTSQGATVPQAKELAEKRFVMNRIEAETKQATALANVGESKARGELPGAFQEGFEDNRNRVSELRLGTERNIGAFGGARQLASTQTENQQAGQHSLLKDGGKTINVQGIEVDLNTLSALPALLNSGKEGVSRELREQQIQASIDSDASTADLNILRGLDIENMIELMRKDGEPTVGERLERRGRGRGTGLASARLPGPSRLDITQGNLGVTPNPDAGLPDGTVIGQGGNQAIIINGETVPLAEWKAFQESRR